MTGAMYQPMGTMAAPVTAYASEPLAPVEPIAEPIAEPSSRSAGGNIPPVTYTAPPIVSPVTQVAAPRQMPGPVTRVWQVRGCGGIGWDDWNRAGTRGWWQEQWWCYYLLTYKMGVMVLVLMALMWMMWDYQRTVCLDVFADCIWEAPCICFTQPQVTKVAAPVTKVTSMGSPKRKLEYHTILREKATVEEVEKAVEVPRVEVAAWQDF